MDLAGNRRLTTRDLTRRGRSDGDSAEGKSEDRPVRLGVVHERRLGQILLAVAVEVHELLAEQEGGPVEIAAVPGVGHQPANAGPLLAPERKLLPPRPGGRTGRDRLGAVLAGGADHRGEINLSERLVEDRLDLGP